MEGGKSETQTRPDYFSDPCTSIQTADAGRLRSQTAIMGTVGACGKVTGERQHNQPDKDHLSGVLAADQAWMRVKKDQDNPRFE